MKKQIDISPGDLDRAKKIAAFFGEPILDIYGKVFELGLEIAESAMESQKRFLDEQTNK